MLRKCGEDGNEFRRRESRTLPAFVATMHFALLHYLRSTDSYYDEERFRQRRLAATDNGFFGKRLSSIVAVIFR